MEFVYLVAVFLIGAILGTQVNHAIYRFMWGESLRISPWIAKHDDASDRKLIDYIPIIGWLSARRDSKVHGKGFWLRPLIIELGVGIGIAWLFKFIVFDHGLIPPGISTSKVDQIEEIVWFSWIAILFSGLVACTFIDFDDMTIPDEITFPGTIIAVLLAAFYPSYRLPINTAGKFDFLHIGSPNEWPSWTDSWIGIVAAISIWLVWCFALLPFPFPWTFRFGFVNCFKYGFAMLLRPTRKTKLGESFERKKPRAKERRWLYVLASTALIGVILITVVFLNRANFPQHWESLCSSLIGLAVSGGLVWYIRVVGFVVLRREAMGFGDVTLMFMVGAFIGWQPGLMVFGFSPFTALFISLIHLIFKGDKLIPYGPYLCLSTIVIIICWQNVWESGEGIFQMGPMFIQLMICIFALTAPLLLVVNLAKRFLGLE